MNTRGSKNVGNNKNSVLTLKIMNFSVWFVLYNCIVVHGAENIKRKYTLKCNNGHMCFKVMVN